MHGTLSALFDLTLKRSCARFLAATFWEGGPALSGF